MNTRGTEDTRPLIECEVSLAVKDGHLVATYVYSCPETEKRRKRVITEKLPEGTKYITVDLDGGICFWAEGILLFYRVAGDTNAAFREDEVHEVFFDGPYRARVSDWADTKLILTNPAN